MKNRIILKKNKMKKLLPVLLIALFFLFSANSVLAASTCGGPLVPCGGMDSEGVAQNACKFCHLFVLFNNLIKFLLFCIVPPIAVAGIVMAGVFFIFSRGNPGTITKAKGIIEAVLIGLFIVFTAWLLINVFFTYINVAEWTGLSKGWFTFEACK
jgi:hypothetical protein